MKIKKDERGVAFLAELLVFVIITGVVGYVGWRITHSSNKPKASSSSSASIKGGPEPVNNKSWHEGDSAVMGKYADADVVQISTGKWRMYYAIQPEVQGNNFEVYSSVSTDGKTWSKETGTRKTMATFPNVVRTADGKYRMYFQAAGLIKSALSSDGLNFTDETGSRIDTSNTQGLTLDNVAAPSVILRDDGSYMMVYRGTINKRYAADTPNSTTQLLFWATSKDGLAFTKQGIAVDSRNSTLRGQLDGPYTVKWDDAKLHTFATTYAGVYEFTFDGSKFSSGEKAYSLNPTKSEQPNTVTPKMDTPPPGDPTLAKINGTWFMYYGATGQSSGIHYATYK